MSAREVIYDDGSRHLTAEYRAGGDEVALWADGVDVHAVDLEDVTRRLYAAARRDMPVMLGRPDIDWTTPETKVGPLRFSKTASGHVSVSGECQDFGELLEPHVARRAAAVLVAYADTEDEDDDQDEVFLLASVMARHPSATFPDLARAVLAEYRVERREGSGG